MCWIRLGVLLCPIFLVLEDATMADRLSSTASYESSFHVVSNGGDFPTLQMPKFDPGLGDLLQINLRIRTELSGAATLERFYYFPADAPKADVFVLGGSYTLQLAGMELIGATSAYYDYHVHAMSDYILPPAGEVSVDLPVEETVHDFDIPLDSRFLLGVLDESPTVDVTSQLVFFDLANSFEAVLLASSDEFKLHTTLSYNYRPVPEPPMVIVLLVAIVLVSVVIRSCGRYCTL